MARTYSDASFANRKQFLVNLNKDLSGTNAAATDIARYTFMSPVTVTDANVGVVVSGTVVDSVLYIGKSAAGTGTVSAIGTITLTGTQTAPSVVDASVTSTDFSTGDDIVVQHIGTETETAHRLFVCFLTRENFVESDT